MDTLTDSPRFARNYRIAEIDPETGSPYVVTEGFKMHFQEASDAAEAATRDTGIRHRPCLVTGEHTFVCLVA